MSYQTPLGHRHFQIQMGFVGDTMEKDDVHRKPLKK